MIKVPVTVSVSEAAINIGAASNTATIPCVANAVVSGGGGGIPYAGPYEATPTMSEQTFATGGKVMSSNFVVHKIPSQYGLVTWNGSVLTVS